MIATFRPELLPRHDDVQLVLSANTIFLHQVFLLQLLQRSCLLDLLSYS